ncbi:MAG: dihydroorotase, partial [Bacteroidales bacterium]
MDSILINGTLVNEDKIFDAHIGIENGRIIKIIPSQEDYKPFVQAHTNVINLKGKYILPGIIDDQVHFREPGLTHKGDLYTESRAAVAGGVTSFMEMPNTKPQTLTQDLLQAKYDLAAQKSLANYSFYMGCSQNNLEEVLKTNPKEVCGIKLFLGSSTGNMLVSDPAYIQELFEKSTAIIAIHSEDENIIQANIAHCKEQYGEQPPMWVHAQIRSEEACYACSKRAIDLARKCNTRLHLLHISTAKELSLLEGNKPLEEKKITAEVCVHHLWFTQKDYAQKGCRIKWNPSIKNETDRAALRKAVVENVIDVVATDHAPHTWAEKDQSYFKSASGGPLIQHSLVAMLELVHQGVFTLSQVVQQMCHRPARLFKIDDRG